MKELITILFLVVTLASGMEKPLENSSKKSSPRKEGSKEGSFVGRERSGTIKFKSLDVASLKEELSKIGAPNLEEKLKFAPQLSPRSKEKTFQEILSLPEHAEYIPYKIRVYELKYAEMLELSRGTLANISTYLSMKNLNFQQEAHASISVFPKYYYQARNNLIKKIMLQNSMTDYQCELEADKDLMPFLFEYCTKFHCLLALLNKQPPSGKST
jgi:hypothetical protein